MERKELLLNNLKETISVLRGHIVTEIDQLAESEKELLVQVRKSFNIEQEIAAQQLTYTRRRIEELTALNQSPFFAKVVYYFDENKKDVYISKYSLSLEKMSNIASWTAPVAELRFQDIGKTDLYLPENQIKEVDLIQKDSYVIGEDKIIYYSQETQERGVEIIYEDFLSTVKSEFGLSEIISKIEKEQYAIIQSDPKISLIISGPAGSGKTTICLHRVAYLIQRPETSELYDGKKLLMLVQDTSTKEYFSSILPKLGIPHMYVETYFDFGIRVLGIVGATEAALQDRDEAYLEYIAEKLKILETHKIIKKRIGKNIVEELDRVYKKHLREKRYALFSISKMQNTFDYLDITIMLAMAQDEDGDICIEEEFHKAHRTGKYTAYRKFTKVNYGMVIVDEFQNYSKDQIAIIRKLIDKKTKALVYIGDQNQKSLLRPESSVSKYAFEDCHRVELNKVYRNTKQILEYIQSIGYKVEIPENAREGLPVESIIVENETVLVERIQIIISSMSLEESIGVLCDNAHIKRMLEYSLENIMKERTNMRVMTKVESQGTEFNSVICINGSGGAFEGSSFESMLKVAQRNADYIGYTRAVEKLFVITLG